MPDIVAQDPRAKRVIFEVKDDRPEGDGKTTNERYVDYPTLIGQIYMRMSDPDADYGVVIKQAGLPWFKQHNPKIALDKLEIRFFVMKKDDDAYELNHEYMPLEIKPM
jgi:hypothetical protein